MFGEHDPTEVQLRWQAFTSIVYGAKGLLYFCYWNPSYQGSTFPTEGSIMAATGPNGTYAPTAHYAQAQKINANLLVYGGYLLHATSTAVLHLPLGYTATDPSFTLGAGAFVTGIVCTSRQGLPGCPDAVATYLIGQFLLEDGRVGTCVEIKLHRRSQSMLRICITYILQVSRQFCTGSLRM